MMRHSFFVLLCVLFALRVVDGTEQKILSSLGCRLNKGCSAVSVEKGKAEKYQRVIAIGDIHGSYNGLLENLYAANITTSVDICHWKQQSVPTLLVQSGDIVDRGPGSLEALECLKSLQDTGTAYNGEVVRIFGNHDMWWLQEYLHMKNKADTRKKIRKFVDLTKEDILSGKVVGAFYLPFHGIPLIFNHAGFSQEFLQKEMKGMTNAQEIVAKTNKNLIEEVEKCPSKKCAFASDFYEAGPERGGKGVGGPYWNDFSVLKKQAVSDPFSNNFIQIVGHSISPCYLRRGNDPESFKDCADGLIRATTDLSAFCVDGGMYAGGRGFLEITSDGHFVAHEKLGHDARVVDFTNSVCSQYCKNEL